VATCLVLGTSVFPGSNPGYPTLRILVHKYKTNENNKEKLYKQIEELKNRIKI